MGDSERTKSCPIVIQRARTLVEHIKGQRRCAVSRNPGTSYQKARPTKSASRWLSMIRQKQIRAYSFAGFTISQSNGSAPNISTLSMCNKGRSILSVKQIYLCDSCGESVHDPAATSDWWALGRFKDGAFIADKHICGVCYQRIFERKVAAHEVRVN